MTEFGTVQKEARKQADYTQEQFALELNLSRPALANIESGRRRMPRDRMKVANEVMDDGFYAMATVQEVLGETWIPVLDGVDLHRSAVREKAIEEIREAMDQITATSMVNQPDPKRRDEVQNLMMECIDVIVCLTHLVAVICREFGISWVGMWREYHRKAEEQGYLKKKKRHRGR